ncbi:MAG TPA: hypothetical protein VHP37_07345 [Burkholderiales bacterium]|nr:hypothetical protein [Burkholderiales bacterium]
MNIHGERANLFADAIWRQTYDGPELNRHEPIMKNTRPAFVLALALMFPTLNAHAGEIPGGAVRPSHSAQAFDVREYEPVHFSGGNTNAFFDGSEDGASNTAAGFDMRDYEPVHFSGGNSNAFFDGTESGGTDTLARRRSSGQ